MTPANSGNETSSRHQYRTAARVQMDDRRLTLRGGIYDGRTWIGVVGVGDRVFCGGDDPWCTAGIYLVTDMVEDDGDGRQVNVARPAFA